MSELGHVTLIDANTVAKQLGVTPNALAKMRMTGDGPAFIKVGRRVMYIPGDVAEWITANRRTTTDEYYVA